MDIIDIHGHLGVWNFPIPASGTADSLLRLCDRYGIRWVVVSSTEAIVYDMERGNEAVAEALQRTDRLLGYVYGDPRLLDRSCRQMDAYLREDKFVGVKIHPSYAKTPIGSQAMQDLIDEVARRAQLVKIHTYSAADAQAIAVLADRHPQVNFVMAHACALDSRAAADVAAQRTNLFLDFCCSHAVRGRVEYALRTCGAARIVFGSDMDLLDPAFTIGMFTDAGLSEAEWRAVFWDNAARILGLSA